MIFYSFFQTVPRKSGVCLLFFFTFVFQYGLAQNNPDRCGTVPFNAHRFHPKGDGSHVAKSRFEEWMTTKMKERHERRLRTLGTSQTEPVLTIPVVVHIIHRGEPVGQDSNIPFEQIEDQIRILNEDFRRQNPDRDQTPPIFQDVAADTRIEFVLARQSPEGFETNGVTRVEGTQSNYNINDAVVLSNLSYWPAENYLNIWVTPLGESLLGFAQFPISNLPGLEGSSNNAFTDGIVVDFRFFGSVGNAISNSLGRTASHEVGHFLGLRHIWGDGDCSVDDFVEDTPLQESQNFGCPSDPFSCGSPDMFQNYMDFTDDVCMNLFTAEQKERMRIVLQNSPRRASLLVSPGLVDPLMVENDAGIQRIIEPRRGECDAQITPTVSVYNAGINEVNSVSVQLFLQDNLVEEVQTDVSLQPGEQTSIAFNTLELSTGGSVGNDFSIDFEVVGVNGTTDNNVGNNNRSTNFIIPNTATLPLKENFETNADTSLLRLGILQNPDQQTTWSLIGAPGFDGPENQALYLNFYDYEEGVGERDVFLTPIYDLSNVREATLSFRYAYAPYIEDGIISSDRFTIGISTDCGATIEEVIFDEAGSTLATVAPQSSPFEPESRAEWQQLSFSLDEYLGLPNVLLVFTGINDWGNNLYLDDIEINVDRATNLDIAIEDIVAPARLSCQTSFVPVVSVRNEGLSDINSYDVIYQIDDEPAVSFTKRDFVLESEENEILTFEAVNLSPGLHTFSVGVSEPNLSQDADPADNFNTISFFIDKQTDVIPLVQQFDDGRPLPDVLSGAPVDEEQDWLVINPDGATTWETIEAEGNGFNNISAYINLNNYQDIGATDRLVSPVLDFSQADEASVFFKISYALLSESYADTLRVLVSEDCGLTYQSVYERAGNDLAILSSQQPWVPQADEDWRQEFVNLSQYAGLSSVRVAFEAVNAYGNNLYLDDIEFYISADDDPLSQRLQENSYRVFPNPYNPSISAASDCLLKVAFNMNLRENVVIQIIDSQGRLVSDKLFPRTLNQTYRYDLTDLPTGMYIFRVFSNSINTTSKLLKE